MWVICPYNRFHEPVTFEDLEGSQLNWLCALMVIIFTSILTSIHHGNPIQTINMGKANVHRTERVNTGGKPQLQPPFFSLGL